MKGEEPPITWDHCIKAYDDLVALYAAKMQRDPGNGVVYQEGMAVAMYKKLEAMRLRDRENEEKRSGQ
jgi:hypothetical protein